MVKLSSKRENFELAYAALDRMVNLLRSQPVDPENDLYWSAVMSVIKGFELCYETCWKFLKHHMLEQYKIETLSPRVVFRLSAEHGLLTRDISDELIKLIDVRNATAHTYNPDLAQSVSTDIVRHLDVFSKVLSSCS